MHRILRAALASVLVVVAVSVTRVPAALGVSPRRACMAQPNAAGDWPLGGHDLSNTRTQHDEHGIDAAAAARLAPAWVFDTGQSSGAPSLNQADINATPVEAGGCVFVMSGTLSDASKPAVFALDAATGKVVWTGPHGVSDPGLGGSVVGSAAVDAGRVIVLVNEQGDGHGKGPYAIALDRSTGAVVWRSPPIVSSAGSYTNASPTVAGGIVIAGFSAAEGDPDGHGGFALLDERSGAVLADTFTIPPSDWVGADGEHYGGGGIWTTPAVDARTGYAYMGTGNPYSKKSEHPNTNAIIKVDLNRHRRTFGHIVGSYKGNIDQSNAALFQASRPTCELVPDDPFRQVPQSDQRLKFFQVGLSNSHGCLQLDLDFGAGPNLIRQPHGRLVVGDLQKSGVYHAVDGASMRGVWTSMLGFSCVVCNGSSTAYDDTDSAVLADVGPGSVMTAVASANGSPRWRSPIGDGIHYEGVSVADGVAYTVDFYGNLDVVDEHTGLPIARRPMLADAGPDTMTFGSAGVAIARGTVFAAAGSHVVAYRPMSAAP